MLAPHTARSAPTADGAAVETILARLRSAWGSAPALEARFEQRTSGPAFPTPVTQHGRLQLERPGKMRWDFEAPDPRSYLSDGSTLWIVDERDRSCTIYPEVDPAFTRLFDLATGQGDPAHDFRITALAPTEGSGEGLRLVPRKPDAALRSVVARFDPVTGGLSTITTESAFGDRTEIRLTEVRPVADIADERFRWTTTAGYREIQAH